MVDTHEVTLAFFTNSKYQGFVSNRLQKKEDQYLTDLRFYRKRIVAMTKELARHANNNNSTNASDDNSSSSSSNVDTGPLLGFYEDYALHLINYFKMVDTKDIIQEKYDNLELATQQPMSSPTTSLETNDFNATLYQKRILVPNLDNYVQIKQQVHKKPGDERDNMPEIIAINLQAPALKTKGIKAKAIAANNKSTLQNDVNVVVNVVDASCNVATPTNLLAPELFSVPIVDVNTSKNKKKNWKKKKVVELPSIPEDEEGHENEAASST